MGIKMLAHFRGYKRLAIAWQAKCSMLVCEERKMMRDSDMAYSNRATMFSRERHLNKAYMSMVREPGSSFAASLRA
jgi:hypothetical protein